MNGKPEEMAAVRLHRWIKKYLNQIKILDNSEKTNCIYNQETISNRRGHDYGRPVNARTCRTAVFFTRIDRRENRQWAAVRGSDSSANTMK